MNQEANSQAVEQTAQTNQQAGTEAPTSTLESIGKEYFAPSDLAAAQDKINEVLTLCNQLGIEPVRNFDPEKEFEAGYGLAILPISKRENNVTITTGVCIAAIPDPATIAAHEGGEDYIRNIILAAVIAKLSNSVRPRSNGAVASSVPFSVVDFITSSRGGESMASFSKLAPVFVKALKKKGINYMTVVLLRQVLQSKSFAAEQFPKFPQTAWESLLNTMIAKCAEYKEDGKTMPLDPAILQSWKANRDSVEIEQDIDLSDFADLV